MKFHVSLKRGLIGKNVDMSGAWETALLTPTELAQWSFIDHQGYSHSVFDLAAWRENPRGDKTNKTNQFFLYSEVVTVDIDSKELSDEEKTRSNIAWFLSQPFIKKHAFMITPSSGNTAIKPNWHLSFKLDKPVEKDPTEYRRIALALQALIDLPTDHQTAKAAQPTMGTLFKDEARHAVGYSWSEVYVNDEAEPVSLDFLANMKPIEGTRHAQVTDIQHIKVRAANYVQSEVADKREKAHFAQPIEARERVVIEALSYILPKLGEETDYELWLQVWMAAFHGVLIRPSDTDTGASERVMRYIVDHPDVYWSDGNSGRRKFEHAWAQHRHKDGGYTVASLFWLARREGWLTETGYEIPENRATQIEVELISKWADSLDELPRRALIQSQTGSGKTQNLIRMWERLNKPKTVVFVPSIKLATELASTLRKAGMPATLYLDANTGRVISPDELAAATVLVTTLQSFATKVHQRGGQMSEWQLVYIEEIDQLLTQFARAGVGFYGTHVREHEARVGFSVLRDAFQNSGYVWGVDATMSQVSYATATALSDTPVEYVLNTWIRKKASVKMIEKRPDAMQLVLKSLLDGKRVVVAADTKDTAREVIDSMTELGALDGKRSILITRETERLPQVKAFMQDVNGESQKYDLVAYNSVMASGVSITDTKPDVIVQFSGYLTPRVNLQILNRYRAQAAVYCYYRTGENLYAKNADDIRDEAQHRVDVEAGIVHVDPVERSDNAKLRTKIGSISIADELLQNRSPREFYMGLLTRDGRKVIDYDAGPASERLKSTLKAVRQVRAEQRDQIKELWPTAPQITNEAPATPEMSDLEVAAGELHGEISGILGSNLQNVVETVNDPRLIAEIVEDFSKYGYLLSVFVSQEKAIEHAERALEDRNKAILTVQNQATLMSLLLTVRFLYHRLDDVLTEELIKGRTPQFLRELGKLKVQYDAVVLRPYQKYDQVIARNENPELRAVDFASIILRLVGLKQKQQRKNRVKGKWVSGYVIDNLDRANTFISWRYGEPLIDVTWQAILEQNNVEKRRRETAKGRFNKMSAVNQAEVTRLVAEEAFTNFEAAVRAVEDGQAWT